MKKSIFIFLSFTLTFSSLIASQQEDIFYITIQIPYSFSDIYKQHGINNCSWAGIEICIRNTEKMEGGSQYVLFTQENKQRVYIKGKGESEFYSVNGDFRKNQMLPKKFEEREFVNLFLTKGIYYFGFRLVNKGGGGMGLNGQNFDAKNAFDSGVWVELRPSLLFKNTNNIKIH